MQLRFKQNWHWNNLDKGSVLKSESDFVSVELKAERKGFKLSLTGFYCCSKSTKGSRSTFAFPMQPTDLGEALLSQNFFWEE